ncbi:LiaI-LiaF-like domain-containing protein [Marinitoga lauensis]|uniref:LiaI-LiaF-like domain-containing protein n=1 Tax=Marinitoga lauensis TaxID=2201189 RepID=UPI001013B8DE|nr:DUF5668 domain-containing protein [Marinitoga lauensis]
MYKNKNLFGGIILVLLGIYLILSNIFDIKFSWNFIWPIFILLPGLKFEYDYYSKRKHSGILVPGGLLTTIGVLFYFCAFFGYDNLEYLWPTFILAPAIGLFQMYLVTKRKEIMYPVIVLGG